MGPNPVSVTRIGVQHAPEAQIRGWALGQSHRAQVRPASFDQVVREQSAGFGDGLVIRVQVALGSRDAPVARDLLQDVRLDTAVRHPGEAGMTKAVACQVLVSERSDYIVPMGSPPKPGR